MKKKLAWIICPNGGGHLFRSENTFLLLKDFLIKKNFEIYFWGPSSESKLLINENFNIIHPSRNYSWPNYTIEDFDPSLFDLIITDNIIEKKLGNYLKKNKETPFIFLSSFLWELIDNDYSKNDILWIFQSSNFHFIYNKYFYNSNLIGNPKSFSKHGITHNKKIKEHKIRKNLINIYITLGISNNVNIKIIRRIEYLIKKLDENFEIYVDKKLFKYLKNTNLISHEDGIFIADLIICRPGLGTLNQALGGGIFNFITCHYNENKEMIYNETSLKKIATVKNIFDNEVLNFIYKISKKQTLNKTIKDKGFEDINLHMKNYINKYF